MAIIQNDVTFQDGLVYNQVSSVSLGTSGAYAHNGIFSSDYDTYLVTMDQIQCATADTHIKFKFYNQTGATSDNTYRGYIPLPPSVKKRVSYFSRSFNISEIESALRILSEIDKRQKTTFSKDETELIQFIGNVIG